MAQKIKDPRCSDGPTQTQGLTPVPSRSPHRPRGLHSPLPRDTPNWTWDGSLFLPFFKITKTRKKD